MSGSNSLAEWQRLATEIDFRTQAFIDGKTVDAASEATFVSVNPANGQTLATVASCDTVDVDRAVSAARRSFEAGVWRDQHPARRKKILLRLADLILRHGDELALLESLNMGKPIADATRVDVPATARCMQWYAEAIDKVNGELTPAGVDVISMVTQEPVGVVACIVPWNFPLLMAAWKVAPALAVGNSVILKPSEKSPLSALRLAELAAEAGLPDGVFNVLPGFGSTAGEALALHMDVDCVAFTGSTITGKKILGYAGQSNMKRVWLECGGKSPNIVLADCPDIEQAAKAAAWGIFFNQGQMCSAASRLIVESSIREPMLERIIAIGRELKPGDPLDPATRLGAIVDKTQLDRVLGYIESGRSEGADLRLGGEKVNIGSGGYYVQPTVFDNVSPSMTIAKEEVFGPVLSTLSFDDLDQAVHMANDTPYGLAAAVWTRDINTAHRTARRLRAGTVWINSYDASDFTVPFGGYKQSGNGRDKSLHALEKYLELKTTWVQLS